jgi:serine protease AprX
MQILLALALILTAAIPLFAPSAAGAEPQIQPQLLQMAEEDPDQTLRLIVQKAEDSQMAEALAAQLGGEIVADLSMIHAFAVEMAAGNAVQLAKSSTVRWVSLDGQVEGAGKPPPKDDPPAEPLPENTYLDTLGVRDVWAMGYDGTGVTVAVIDTGIQTNRDFSTEPGKPFTRIVKAVNLNPDATTNGDLNGHGTHVAGILAGHGGASDGLYSGVAPKVELVNLRVTDDFGMAYESDVVAAMQWIYDNKELFNIRVVNLSINSTVTSSYHESPMNAAAEILWFNGVVVVTSAGNYWDGSGFNPVLAAPANDPFLITVGAVDEKGTARTQDDVIANYSAFGTTADGYFKPDIYAPGTDIISVLAPSSEWEYSHPDRVVMDGKYFRLSGTSMASPMVTGAVALLLQAEPDLTPDQVKYRLTNCFDWIGPSKYMDVYKFVTCETTESANTGLEASQLLWTGDEPVVWGSVAWNSVAWNSVAWNSVAWNSVAWNSVAWNSVAWNE